MSSGLTRTGGLKILLAVVCRTVVAIAINAKIAQAQGPTLPSPAVRQSLDDAWWTGPMLAPSANTLP